MVLVRQNAIFDVMKLADKDKGTFRTIRLLHKENFLAVLFIAPVGTM